MSNSIAKVYADSVKKNQKILYGVWEPGFPVKLGDFGIMNGNIFTQLGNISELEDLKDFEIKYRTDETKDEKTFISERGVTFNIKPQVAGTVEGVKGNASIDVNFSKEGSVFFNAAECVYEIIENKYELGKRLLEIHRKSKHIWKKEFVVVTDRVNTKRALILISTSSDFAISLEASAEVPVIDLSQASLGLKISFQKSSGYKFISEDGIIPLVGLSKIQSPFPWFTKEMKPFTARYSSQMVESIKDFKMLESVTNEDNELQFSQYTEDLID
ncbi:hypothetical protein Q765_06940 [Flavobacterium rivuli WB 3.3-2 = DSM 21788]|uniref:Uncharacterized protein n=1 Tax=Flavobacterium rivuli WB 3.3-2 = DSM 21788 TaxID=1121895 RepID=A0A0A2M533_9FLAO|nr:hypothetical protein [Flavobacterium rivuli]KGO87394.1 hypothetical protein Q765_06940 [Flavobacterium rivuli WB 3.3-2 = DSM 21788]